MDEQFKSSDEFANDIAIIGMSGRFPGAKTVDEFWDNLINGRETMKEFSDIELEKSEYDFNELKNNPNYIKRRGVLEDIDKFDASFFGISPREASMMDPQHRIWLEIVWEALENAGHASTNPNLIVGVFAGCTANNYFLHNILRSRAEIEDFVRGRGSSNVLYQITNETTYLPLRVSYKFNFKGPSINVQTACSTSLVAICMASQSLLNFESDMCIAGGICTMVPQETGYFYTEASMLSSDGYCRPFDAAADGTVFSNGAGVVILRRLEDAINDRDNILAVIKGTAVNNDGSDKVSFIAPGIDGQVEAIAAAQSMAGLDPESITYIEAHGTGTHMGDPIEVAALRKVFEAKTKNKKFCGIGSLKSNFGHLDVAAGVASLIKTVLALQNKQIPPTIHYKIPNPEIDFENSPFFVVDKLMQWHNDKYPLRAGVSAFGFGGTNAHVILEEAPVLSIDKKSKPCQILMLSAKTDNALNASVNRLRDYLQKNPTENLPDIAYSLALGRKDFENRCFIVCENKTAEIQKIKTDNIIKVKASGNKEIAFMFPGQGSQYLNMGLDLYNHEPVFKESVDLCCMLASKYVECNFKSILFPGDNITNNNLIAENNIYAQLAIFTIDYSLAKLWMYWGVNPKAVIGHSLGEWVSACIAEVISIQDAIKVIFHRGRLMQSVASGGSAVTVKATFEEISKYISGNIALAVVNAPSYCVISGPEKEIENCCEKLKNNNITYKKLNINLAVHSSMIDPIIEPFKEILKDIKFSDPKIPIMSSVTGDWVLPQELKNIEHWIRNIRNMVKFSDAVKKISENNNFILLEVGPSKALSKLAVLNVDRKKTVIVSSLTDINENNSEWKAILEAIGKLWTYRVLIDWKNFYKIEKRRFVPLPTYPFEKQRYWIDPPARGDFTERIKEEILREEEQINQESPILSHGNDEFGPSMNDIEKKIAAIWQDTLGIETIEKNSDFFDLGGHSLLALELIGEINKHFNSNFSTTDFFDNPTIASMAEIILGKNGIEHHETKSRIKSINTNDNINVDIDKFCLEINDVFESRKKINQNISHKKSKTSYRMRESFICKYLLAIIYKIDRRSLRSLLQNIILKLEGDEWYTITLRKLYAKYYNVHIGDYTGGCFDIGNFKRYTTFGRYSSITRTARFERGNHPSNTISSSGLFYRKDLHFTDEFNVPRNNIKIGNDVFIGHNVSFLSPAKEIGDGAVIGAGSIVNFDVPPYAVVAGYPAKIIRYRFPKEIINKLLETKWWDLTLEELESLKGEFIKPIIGKSVR